MTIEVARLTHAEMVRRRDEQMQRIASVRARSSGILGASGLAATLASTIGNNGGYVVAVVCYAFATTYAVLSMRLTTLNGKSPEGLIDSLKNKDEKAATVALVSDLVVQLVRNEKRLTAIGKDTKIAIGWFLAGTILTALVAGISVILTIQGR